MRRRVVISGMGSLSSAGSNIEETAASFSSGRNCLHPISDLRIAHLKARYAGLLQDFERELARLPQELRESDKHVAMAWVAATEALRHAKVDPKTYGCRLGLIFSTCSGPMLLIEKHYERVIAGDTHLSPEELFAKRYYSGAQMLASVLGIGGLSTTIVTACTASTAAIALAADLVRCGMLEAALAGGSDAFSTSTLAGFDGLKATSEGKCAPFSKPYGLNLGEAASFVFIESLESASQRGATVHAEIAGSGLSNDAYHCSAPEPTGRGLALAIQRALADAGFGPEDIRYINAHGTGTEANDKAEMRALRKVFGEQVARVPVSSTKSMVGHCLGAAGAIEVIASILCAQRGLFPPTVNFSVPREGCTLDYVPDVGRAWSTPRTFLSSNLAFGGHNATLVLSVADPQPIPTLAGSPSPTAADYASPSRPALSPAAGEAGSPPLRDGPPQPEICVAGLGLVSCCGVGLVAQGAMPSRDGPHFTPVSIPGLPEFKAGFVPEDVIGRFDRRLDLRQMDRSSRWATVATRAAMRDAGLPDTPHTHPELGLFLGLSAGPSWAESEFLTSFLSNHRQVGQLVAFPYIVPSSVAGNVCRALRLTGHNLTLSCGPGAGLLALGPALAAIATGHAEALLVGAADELTTRILTDNWMAGKIAADGVPPGEGAAVLLLETAVSLEKRGRKPLARIRGWGFLGAGSGDVPAAIEQVISSALAQAGISADRVDLLCALNKQSVVNQVVERMSKALQERWHVLESTNGRLEASQPLFDVASALAQLQTSSPSPSRLLAVSSSPESGHAALVLETA